MGGHGGSSGSIQSGNAISNVFMEGQVNTGDGSGSTFQNIDGAEVAYNIYTDPTNITNGFTVMNFRGDRDRQLAKNQKIHHNIIYGVRGGEGLTARGISHYENEGYPPMEIDNIKIYENDIQYVTGSEDVIFISNSIVSGAQYYRNRYYSASPVDSWFSVGHLNDWTTYSEEIDPDNRQINYPDPERTLKTYNVSLGGNADTEEFMIQVLLQSRHSWRSEYTAAAVNNYIRAGFGMDPLE